MIIRDNGSDSDVYNEYLYINGEWELIGNTTVDLSDYYTKEESDAKFIDNNELISALEGRTYVVPLVKGQYTDRTSEGSSIVYYTDFTKVKTAIEAFKNSNYTEHPISIYLENLSTRDLTPMILDSNSGGRVIKLKAYCKEWNEDTGCDVLGIFTISAHIDNKNEVISASGSFEPLYNYEIPENLDELQPDSYNAPTTEAVKSYVDTEINSIVQSINENLTDKVNYTDFNTDEFNIPAEDNEFENISIKEISGEKISVTINEDKENLNDFANVVSEDIDYICENGIFADNLSTQFDVKRNNQTNLISKVSIKSVSHDIVDGLKDNYVGYDNVNPTEFQIETIQIDTGNTDADGNPIYEEKKQVSIEKIEMDKVAGLSDALGKRLEKTEFTTYVNETVPNLLDKKLDKEAFETFLGSDIVGEDVDLSDLLNNKLDIETFKEFYGEDNFNKDVSLADLLNGKLDKTFETETLPGLLNNKLDKTFVGEDILNANKTLPALLGDELVAKLLATGDSASTLNDILAEKVDLTTAKGNDGNGIRFINQDEIDKLEKLVLGEDGEVGISGTINAANVKELDSAVISIVTRQPAEGVSGLGIETGAQVNKIESVQIDGTALTVSNKTVNIAVSSATNLGVVRSADKENYVYVHQTNDAEKGAVKGEMEIKSLNVDRLVQTPGTRLILNGGNAGLTD